MLVSFTSDESETSTGWYASYTSSQPTSYCSGTTNLTAASGSFTDGSGANSYLNNSNCKWLIQPSGATSITLSFSAFNTESGYDYVKVYDGSTTSAALIGSFSGTSIPASVTSSGGSMLVSFTSDGTGTSTGWSASYTSSTQTTSYCSGTSNLTAASGSFTDGSGANNYLNNSNCKWLIQPSGATSITLSFSAFNTELGYDYVRVYDGSTTSAALIGSFSGTSIPASVTSSGGSMLVNFTSDGTANRTGWSASYTSLSCPLPLQPAPIGGSTSVCLGQTSVPYSVSNVAGVTYNWTYSGTGATISGSGYAITVSYSNSATSVTLSVTASNSCVSSASTKDITVNPLPPKPLITSNFSNPENPILTSSSVNGNQWYHNNTMITDAINQSYSPTKQGVYSVKVTLSGCSSEQSETVAVIVTGDIPASTSGIQIYPNPVSTTLILKGNVNSTNEFEIADLLGRVVKFKGIKSGDEYLIDIRDLSSGPYLLLIQEGNSIRKIRFVKK
jgi:hypothetical protein